MFRIAIFASGAGSNAAEIIRFFNGNPEKMAFAKVTLLVCNRPKAGVLQYALEADIPSLLIDKKTAQNPSLLLHDLRKNEIDFIVLAGFLWKIPTELCAAFSNKILNIHPSLLPKYGGKGMYGAHVHAAVLANKEKKSGITIHLVNEQYDEGQIINQISCEVLPDDTVEKLSKRIQTIELATYKEVIFSFLTKL